MRGAIRGIREGNKVTSNAGVELRFNRSFVPHAIVLVSELFPFGAWDDVVSHAVALARDWGVFVHILDLRELAALVHYSKDKYVLDYNLMQRFEHFIRTQTVFIRVQPPKDLG